MIKSWSYSRLLDFEKCPYSAKLKIIDKIPEEKSEAADRGTHIHGLAESFVRGEIADLPKELAAFSHEFLALRKRFEAGQVSLEGDWGFDADWLPAEFRTAWLRMKLDARVRMGDTSLVIDYKTGKRFGNELKHGEQTVLYGIAEAIREPDVETIIVELWYLDLPATNEESMIRREFTREEILRYLPRFDKRGKAMTSAKSFPPNPNVFSCKWCSYGPNKGQQCEYGVVKGDTAISIYRRKYG